MKMIGGENECVQLDAFVDLHGPAQNAQNGVLQRLGWFEQQSPLNGAVGDFEQGIGFWHVSNRSGHGERNRARVMPSVLEPNSRL